MKSSLSTFALAALGASLFVFQTGCISPVYPVAPAPVGYRYAPTVPVVAWAGPGYYGGSYYRSRSTYYNSGYYRNYRGGSGASYRTPYSNGGHYDTAQGGSASWRNGSGSADGARGGSASWNRGSGGSAQGWRGSSASWGGGSASWDGTRGRSGSVSRR